jgi:hypothetical protein
MARIKSIGRTLSARIHGILERLRFKVKGILVKLASRLSLQAGHRNSECCNDSDDSSSFLHLLINSYFLSDANRSYGK